VRALKAWGWERRHRQFREIESRRWDPIPEPVDRVSFFEEQARHRRSTWRLSALCLLVVAGMAFVMSCIVGPLLLAQVSIFGWVLNLFGRLPASTSSA
jgi:hypothetical protein